MHEDVDINFWGLPIYHGNKDTDRITVSDFIHVFTGFLNYHKQNPEINENSAPEAFNTLLIIPGLTFGKLVVAGDRTTPLPLTVRLYNSGDQVTDPVVLFALSIGLALAPPGLSIVAY